MSDFDNGDPDSDDFVSSKPWMGVAIPFSIVVAIIFCCVVVFYHRRNVKLQRNGLALDRQGRIAVQRDILEDGYGGDSRPPGVDGYHSSSSNFGFRDHRNHHGERGYYPPNTSGQQQQQQQRSARETGGRRQPRVANRWAWASSAERGFRSARAPVHSEGLDENGQAPPPYKPYDHPQDKMAAEAQAVEEHIELSNAAVSAPAPAHVRRSGSGRRSDGETAAPRTTADRMPASQTGASPETAASEASTLPATLPPAYSDVAGPKRPN